MKIIKKLKLLLIILLINSASVKAHSERNMLSVYINSFNQLFVEQELIEIKDLKDIVKEFITNPKNDNINSEQFIRYIDLIGDIKMSKGLVSIQCERSTTYEFYIKVQNELEKAFNELRNELALKKFNNHYKKLSKAKQSAISNAIPTSISEAEPNLVRNEKWELVENNRGWYW